MKIFIKYSFIVLITIICFISCDGLISKKNELEYTNTLDSMFLKYNQLFADGLHEEALIGYKKIIKITKENDSKYLAKAYLSMANCYYKLDIPNKGSHFLFLSEQNANNDPETLGRINLLKGFILFNANLHDEALKKFENALRYTKQIDDEKISGLYTDRALINIGNIYFQKENYNKALENYFKGFSSTDIANRIGSSINIAETYLLINKIESAKKYLDYAEKHINSIPHKTIYLHVQEGYNGVKGLYFIKTNEFNNAINILKNNKSSSSIYNSNELLGLAYAKIKNNDSAAFYFEKNVNEKLNKKKSELNTTEASIIIYNDEKSIIEKKQKEQKIVFTIFAGLSIISLIALAFMFYYKQKMNKKNTQFLKSETEKLKMEKELSDLKQEHYQKQVLATSIKLEQKNKFLEELKQNITKSDFNINTYLKNEQFIDKDLTNIHDIIKEVHPNFFNNLNKISPTKLTNLDIKYAAYIYMNMDNSQISNILNVDPKTVSVTKYRLKQKLGLTKDVNLETFIRSLNQ